MTSVYLVKTGEHIYSPIVQNVKSFSNLSARKKDHKIMDNALPYTDTHATPLNTQTCLTLNIVWCLKDWAREDT